MNQGMAPGTEDGFMQGMLWGGILLMAIPVLLGIGIGVFALHRYLTQRSFPARGRARN